MSESQSVAAAELLQFIERVERLEEEKKTIAEDLKELYAEAKGRGYDTKVLKWVVAERKIEAAEREERDAMRDLYGSAIQLDMFGGGDA